MEKELDKELEEDGKAKGFCESKFCRIVVIC